MSLAENFQFFSGLSSRSRKRLFCSFFDRADEEEGHHCNAGGRMGQADDRRVSDLIPQGLPSLTMPDLGLIRSCCRERSG